MLLNELNHRTQNTLATVQAIAVQTLARRGRPGAVGAFEQRILALSQAHRLLGGKTGRGRPCAMCWSGSWSRLA